MFYLICIYLIGLNFAPWLFKKFDFWSAQALWSQLSGLLMFGLAFINKPERFVVNKPFGLFLIWAGFNTAGLIYFNLNNSQYDLMSTFLIFYNVITFYFIYNSIVNFLKVEHVNKVLNVIRWIVILNVSICILQYFDLDQFFRLTYVGNKNLNNIVSGFTSQPTMFAGFLAMMTPLFLCRNKRQDCLFLALIWVILAFYTGTTFGDPSSSGILTGVVSMLSYFMYTHKEKCKVIFLSLIPIIGIYFLIPPQIRQGLEYNNGRFELWSFYYNLFHSMPITGAGFNIVNAISLSTPYPEATHLHFEIFELAFTLGIIGLIIFLYGLQEFFSIKTDYKKEEAVIKSVMIGFLVSSCFNYPAHLWIIMGYICFFYAALFVLKHESNKTA